MTDPAISVRNLGKRYAIGEAWRPRQVRELLANPAQLFRRAEQPAELWALRDVSLDIPESKVVGIVGRNGAGKSTMLKILSRITEPTTGEVRIYGRVASLLEVGTGFHPELTGRENIYLNGSILGMSRAEIRRKFDEMVAFAEIDRLLDTPVKRYSSGMFVRLAFAVAAHVEPEILLVDEVLAVGDASFQRKCLGKISDIVSEGRTVVVVSHNMSIVTQLCEAVIWLDKGELVEQGAAASVIGRYLSAGIERQIRWEPLHSRNEGFVLHAVELVADEVEYDAFPADHPITLQFVITVTERIPPSRLGFLIRNSEGLNVIESHSSDVGTTLNEAWPMGRFHMRCTIPGGLLRPGRYFVTVGEPSGETPIVHENVLDFTISEQNSIVARDGRSALIAPVLPWEREAIA
ncbi:MAG TPA: ABC transporter ATP-binding protein [Thermoanaerobaculia bacterium]|jgi:lipopolysaccharide transport system ATP-binding protein